MWGFGDMGMFGFGGFFGIIFWILIVWWLVSILKNGSGLCCGNHGGINGDRKEDRAMSILKERYAKGEISKEEFERMKNDLG